MDNSAGDAGMNPTVVGSTNYKRKKFGVKRSYSATNEIGRWIQCIPLDVGFN